MNLNRGSLKGSVDKAALHDDYKYLGRYIEER